jgi:hypothetical protein
MPFEIAEAGGLPPDGPAAASRLASNRGIYFLPLSCLFGGYSHLFLRIHFAGAGKAGPNSKRRGSKVARNSFIRTAKRTPKLSVNRTRSGTAFQIRLIMNTVLSSIRSCSPICRRRLSSFRAYCSNALQMSFAVCMQCSRITASSC